MIKTFRGTNPPTEGYCEGCGRFVLCTHVTLSPNPSRTMMLCFCDHCATVLGTALVNRESTEDL